ncbi:MAG: alpha/beta fold hydrolase [Candidatus Nanopelagicales bacterium]
MDEFSDFGGGMIARKPTGPVGSAVGDGTPVLIIGGLASTPTTLRPLTNWLEQLGWQPVVAPVRAGLDCGERTMPAIDQALEDIRLEYGGPPVVVAHSRGGQFARAATVRNPDAVRALITLGSPINRLLAVHPLLRIEVSLLSVAGAIGVPGLFSPSCLWGACCRTLRDDLLAPFPQGVPYLSVYSRRDAIVDWRSCLDPAARHLEVDASHIGLINSAGALEVVAQEIARCVRSRGLQPAQSIAA